MAHGLWVVLAALALTHRLRLVSAAAVPVDEYLKSCTNDSAVSTFNETSAFGSWYLLHCYANKNIACSESNCISFKSITPQEMKSLSERYSSRIAGVSWNAVLLEIFSPCSTADPKNPKPNGPSYLEKLAPGSYRLLNFPSDEKRKKALKPRQVRLQLVQSNFLLMLDCADMDLIVLARPPPPAGYNLDPAMTALLAYSQPDY